MKDPAVSYFFKKYYGNIIKWWFVSYNPDVIKIYASKEERAEAERREEAMRLEEQEAAASADSTYNAETCSYSGLYGQQPLDDDTQAAFDTIMSISSQQSSVDSLFRTQTDPQPEDVQENAPDDAQDAVIREANAIYERLRREAAEDEAKKRAEIEEAKKKAGTAV